MGEKNQGGRELAEQAAALRLPEKTDQRLQYLMDRNNEGLLDQREKEELESLVEVNATLSLLRARAFHILGRKP